MKKMDAIHKPYKLGDVREALEKRGIDRIMASEVCGHGRQKGHTEVYGRQEHTVDFPPKASWTSESPFEFAAANVGTSRFKTVLNN
jgi:nitrogen regulatory protein PII